MYRTLYISTNFLNIALIFIFSQFLILGLTYVIVNPADFNKFMNHNSYIVSVINLFIFLPIFLKIYKKYKDKYSNEIKDIPKLIIFGFVLSFVLNYIIYRIKLLNGKTLLV